MPVPDPPSLRTVRLSNSIRTEPEDTWDPHGRRHPVNMTPGRAYGTDSCAGGARLPRHVAGGSSATRRDHRDDWQH